MDADQTKAALNERAEEFAQWLFPAGRKNGHEWKVGSLRGESGDSLGIRIAGTKVGVFCDFATDEKGKNLIELYSLAHGVEFAPALRACRDWLGVSVSSPTRSVRARSLRKIAPVETEPAKIANIPESVAIEWENGVDYFFNHPEDALALAEFRGWPLDFALYAIESGWISMPLYDGQRGLAFKVIAPDEISGAMVIKPVGYHIRLEPKSKGWRYVPNGSQGIPALPLMIGDFNSARLLVVCEGEWDAITFALAADWLGEGCNWPRGVAVVGVRGVTGVTPFLNYYRRFWPTGANCLVLADADRAGETWYKGDDCFAAQLTKVCNRVAVVRCEGFKDFGELYKAQTIEPDQIRELLAKHGMSLETEVPA
jgi:hypothetical protein